MAKKRYTIELDMYIQADNDYMARKIAHKIADEVKEGYEVSVKTITETPFGSFNTRALDDISKPSGKNKEEELPF